MTSNWKKCKLQDLTLKQNQGVNTTTEKVKYCENGTHKVVRAKNILPYKLLLDDVVYIDDNTFKKINDNCKPQKNDILYTNIGSQLGNASLVTTNEDFIIAWNVLRLQLDQTKILPSYCLYLLNSNENKQKIVSLNSSSTMPFVSGTELSKVEFIIPPLETQQKIAKVLSAIDDKIELNNSINNNLEQQAQAMFLESIRTSNFNNVSLINVSTIKYGKGLPTSKLVQSGYKVFGGNGVIGYHTDYMYEKPQILISCRGAASGTIQESYPYSFITNNSLIIEFEDRRYYEFIKQYLFLNQLHSYATGSAQPQITIDNLKTVEVPYPDYAVIANLSDNLSVLSKKIYDNICENELLVQLRDTLLPKLMSGEIDVDKVEV